MMFVKPVRKRLIITFSFFIALILEIIPVPYWIRLGRPEWVLVMLIFWVVAYPKYVGLSVAFLVGLLMDLLMGTVLGQHAFVFSTIIYALIVSRSQFSNFLLWQQSVIVFLLVFFELALEYWVLNSVGLFQIGLYYWLPALSSALVWPWFYFFLKRKQAMVSFYRYGS